MSNHTTGGFALLEVVVALALLAVSTLVITEALGAALEYARAARAARSATAVAAAIAHTFDDRASYPSGWRVAGTPGPDGLPGTRDDGPPDASAPRCWRRLVYEPRWIRIDAACGPVAPGVGPVAAPPGGRLSRRASLRRWR